jgi:hypothetical protein
MIYQNANSASAERYKEANNEAQIANSSGLSTNQKRDNQKHMYAVASGMNQMKNNHNNMSLLRSYEMDQQVKPPQS